MSKLHRIEYFQETIEGDRFNIKIPDSSPAEAILSDGKLKYVDGSEEVVEPSKIGKYRSQVCAVWSNTLMVQDSDANCCFAFMVDNVERVLCEVSELCIVRAKKLIRFLVEECRANGTVESGVKPKHKSEQPFYKNELTYNYGWDTLLMYKDPAEAAREAEAEAEKKIAQEEVTKVNTEHDANHPSNHPATPNNTNHNHDLQKLSTESDKPLHVRGTDDALLDNHETG